MAIGDSRTGLPLWLKLGYSAFILAWVPAYLRFYGPQNFLWLCDFGNLLVLLGLWLESPLLLSSQLVSMLLICLLWTLDVTAAAVTGSHPIGGTEYMFRADIPLQLRLYSLFHAGMPALLVYAVCRLGYDRRGWRLQVAICWILLPLSYLFTAPDRAVNWVWGPFGRIQTMLPDWQYLIVCMAVYPLLLYLPTHGLILAAGRLARLPRSPGRGD